ncbi:VOC family protein [Haliangium ochraceum]|uniref:Glyoxalase/bleomycin resistance protein/dioxygenase n=1 Tax=Haliangium ochraceum (strain DSM 14365 / JCM 11303 / SMP-2) TaxID=502025 RepID=D0LL81_HALO1|nr:VOC family protein [Haliangium ochraceum]ACY18577.1 Glyoxalase/bleomycin resistance protein/dioxygenase [Haliangium ochraceum DSM 14365]
MSFQSATPYLHLNGKAEEAMAFYQSALGADLISSQRFGELDDSCPAAMKDRIMHAVMKVGEGMIMMSDGMPDAAPPAGMSVSVALSCTDAEATRKRFDALAEGGAVIAPFNKAPWGAWFGSLTDKYGIAWMFNCDQPS